MLTDGSRTKVKQNFIKSSVSQQPRKKHRTEKSRQKQNNMKIKRKSNNTIIIKINKTINNCLPFTNTPD